MQARLPTQTQTKKSSFTPVSTGLLQRKCASCGQYASSGGCSECSKKQQLLQRRTANQAESLEVPPIAYEVLNSPGQPLERKTRGFMESRFGNDFSQVRVHTDAKAADSAKAVDATAYTVGNSVVFNTGHYAPETVAGQRLLAHELTHVMQQRQTVGATPQHLQLILGSNDASEIEAEQNSLNVLSGRPLPNVASIAGSTLQRQQSGQPGTSQFSEHVDTVVTSSATPNVWSGSVRREEATSTGTLFNTGRAPVRYDENNCSVTVPMKVAFRHATLSDVQNCPPQLDQSAPTSLPAQLDTTSFRRIADEYVRNLNEDLNGWYSVRFDGCETNRCHGRDMPIQVQVSEASAGGQADYEVAIANLAGRSCVDDSNFTGMTGQPGMVLLYAQGLDRGTMAHEGGHMVLGHGDEYREQEQPSPGRPDDRVREGDWSRMASHHRFGRFALMHERHFAFVPAFLNRVRFGCNARLVELQRPPQVDLTLELGAGYASFAAASGRTHGFYEGLGVSLGVPLSRQREWELIIGVHGRWLAELDSPGRQAFLLGVRLGLEHTFRPSLGGLTLGGFGEAGVSWVSPGRGTGSSYTGGYAEGGAYLGYTSSPFHLFGGGTRASLRLEGAAGATSPFVGRIGEPGMPVPTDPEQLRYFRLGLNAALRF
ncbi:hypothetical protein CAL7716_052700 [Calothrix sp. PCC 7716]|nr:hypothetical protein CAL7716_052700 [Calothrix sp. PCC 7716]